MGFSDLASKVMDGIKVYNNADLAMTVVDMKESYINLLDQLQETKEELRQAKRKINDLEELLAQKEKVKFNYQGYYEIEGTNIKCCSLCYEAENKLISLQQHYEHTWVCLNCNNQYAIE